jgi:hypothetical protein
MGREDVWMVSGDGQRIRMRSVGGENRVRNEVVLVDDVEVGRYEGGRAPRSSLLPN